MRGRSVGASMAQGDDEDIGMANRAKRQLAAVGTLADPRWVAVANRAGGFDGQFFYSVRTTGVYCKPSCRARPPHPGNVLFHPSSQAAEASGFRPCKLCRPA